METEIYIGNSKLDYNDELNCEYSIMDFREFQSGSNNTSYTINVPLTDTNRRILKYSDLLSSFDEVTDEGTIFINDIQILKGKVKILTATDKIIKIIISINDLLKPLKDRDMDELDLSTYNFTHNETNILASWSASAGAFYRYPRIYFTTEKIYFKTYSFIPFFNIKTILDNIFSGIGFKIESVFLNTTWFKDLYISTKEFINDSEFSGGQDFESKPTVVADNQDGQTVSALTTDYSFDTIFDPIVNNSEVTASENYDTTTSLWTCPATGTYKFVSTIEYVVDWDGCIRTGGSTLFAIMKNSTVIVSDTIPLTISTTRQLTTEYIHLVEGDIVKTKLEITQVVNNNDSQQAGIWQHLTTTGTSFKMYPFSEQNLYIGEDYPIVAKEWLPETSQMDFVTGLKQLFNLCFFVDNWNKKIYIEPFESFIGTGINVIRDVEYMTKSKDIIGKDWAKKIHIDFNDDSSDYSLQEYNKKYSTKSGRKTINLTSTYNKEETKIYENSTFSTFGNFPEIGVKPYSELSVLNEYGNRNFRPQSFNTKICHWDGLTADTETWVFEGSLKITFPKVSVLDMDSIYGLYFNKYFHLIDQGTLVTITAPTDLIILTQLNTVINDATIEGFRALYQFDYEGETHLGVLQSAVTNGYKTKYTLLLIK